MKISWPRREIVSLCGFFLFFGICGVSAFKQWNINRSTYDAVTAGGFAAIFFFILWQGAPPLWQLVHRHRFEVLGGTFNQTVEMAPGEVLVVGPLQGIERKKLLVRFDARSEERPGLPYKSFQVAPSPIHHHINSTCEVVLYDVSRGQGEEVAWKTLRIETPLPDTPMSGSVEDHELFAEPLHEGGQYFLQFQPRLPEVVSHDGQRILKWKCKVSVTALVEQFGVYDEVRLNEANGIVIPAVTPAA